MRIFLFLLFSIGIFTSCKVTKYVPPHEYLLNRVKVKLDNKDITKEKLKSYMQQNPNTSIWALLRFNLFLYNLSGTNDEKSINRFLKKNGEPPVIYDEMFIDQTLNQFKLFLNNKGYYDLQLGTSIDYDNKKKKVNVIYTINLGKAFKINQIKYKISDNRLKKIIFSDTINSLLKVGNTFDTYEMDRERNRITQQIKRKGFYHFQKDYIEFLADTSMIEKKTNISLLVNNPSVNDSLGNIVTHPHTKYKINNIYYYSTKRNLLNSVKSGDNTGKLDTLMIDNQYFIFEKKLYVKPTILIDKNLLKKDDVYSNEKVQRTEQNFFSLKQYRFVNFDFDDINANKNDSIGVLNVKIHLVPLKKQSYSVELDGTNKSGNFGGALSIRYEHLNLFKGAEIVDFNISGNIESQTKSQYEISNILEYATSLGVTFPRLLFLKSYSKKISKRFDPITRMEVSYSNQHRPDYNRTISNINLTYRWKNKGYLTHILSPINFNNVYIASIDSLFLDNIKNTYIENSYKSHLTAYLKYTFLFNNKVKKSNNSQYLKYNLQLAGNLFSISNQIIGTKKHRIDDPTKPNEQEEYYTFLNQRYAQFIKSDIEFVRNTKLDDKNTMVFRIFGGVGYPFGNLNVLPFEERYYSGGTNDIRAWGVRSLGPGAKKYNQLRFPNISSDIKLSGNIEYRYKLFSIVEGALFVDAGNIWDIIESTESPEAYFKWNEFYKQIAVGTGTGIRFDFPLFLLRFDFGLKLIDPSESMGKQFILTTRKITNQDWTFNFAIGYPF